MVTTSPTASPFSLVTTFKQVIQLASAVHCNYTWYMYSIFGAGCNFFDGGKSISRARGRSVPWKSLLLWALCPASHPFPHRDKVNNSIICLIYVVSTSPPPPSHRAVLIPCYVIKSYQQTGTSPTLTPGITHGIWPFLATITLTQPCI
jgi:hypothetical protein